MKFRGGARRVLTSETAEDEDVRQEPEHAVRTSNELTHPRNGGTAMKPTKVRVKALLLVAVVAAGATTIAASSSTASAAGPSGVSSHFVLPAHTLASGAAEQGTLVIANQTGHPLQWNCGYLEVQLTNAHQPLELHPTPCRPSRTLPVGTTRLRFHLRASRTVCQGTCPALPPGTYRTHLFPGLPTAVHPNPISVRVVTGSRAR
jgi:hypothetical protein